eukprot:265268-Rhodomonas_salina.2
MPRGALLPGGWRSGWRRFWTGKRLPQPATSSTRGKFLLTQAGLVPGWTIRPSRSARLTAESQRAQAGREGATRTGEAASERAKGRSILLLQPLSRSPLNFVCEDKAYLLEKTPLVVGRGEARREGSSG